VTTLISILYGSHGNAVSKIEKSLPPFSGRVTVTGRDIAQAVADALDTPVGDLAMDAWSQCSAVAEACRRTAGRPYAREVVRLLSHDLTSTQDIDVEMDFGGTRQTVLTITVRVDFKVNFVSVVVVSGRVADLESGTASVLATLSIGPVEIARGSVNDTKLASNRAARVA
jgi:hypothetical protein